MGLHDKSKEFWRLKRKLLIIPLEVVHCVVFTLLYRSTTDSTTAITTAFLFSLTVTIWTALACTNTNMVDINCWAVTWLGWTRKWIININTVHYTTLPCYHYSHMINSWKIMSLFWEICFILLQWLLHFLLYNNFLYASSIQCWYKQWQIQTCL